jgi:hypothetical protein
MPSNAENLATIKSNILATLAEITNPATRKISYSVDGQSVSWTEYQRLLMEQLRSVNELLQSETPYEIRSSVL